MRTITKVSPEFQVDTGPAPMLQWIDIHNLVIDDAYQRELTAANWKAIRRIASQFKWSRFSPVFCAPITGGKYAIIDGQHRTHAAMLCGIETVPCQIVQMDQAEQAEAFGAVNGNVTAITVWNLLRAQLAANEPAAVALQAACEAAGCRLATANASAKNKKPGVVYFIGAAQKLHARYGRTFETALGILRKCSGFDNDAQLWAGQTVIPLIEALCAQPDMLTRPDIRDIVDDFDIYGARDIAHDERRRRTRLGLPAISSGAAIQQAFAEHLKKALNARDAA